MDLCRPFAAHCIGYPMVTLGFGFKSYIGYKFRQRKQKEVQRENDFYIELLQQALPVDSQPSIAPPPPDKNIPQKQEEIISNGVCNGTVPVTPCNHQKTQSPSSSSPSSAGLKVPDEQSSQVSTSLSEH
jgi:hypothetical protein